MKFNRTKHGTSFFSTLLYLFFKYSVGRREFHSCLEFGAKRKGINEAEKM